MGPVLLGCGVRWVLGVRNLSQIHSTQPFEENDVSPIKSHALMSKFL